MSVSPPIPPFPHGAITVTYFLIAALVGLVALVISVVIWWKIFAKTGYGGPLGFSPHLFVFCFTKCLTRPEFRAILCAKNHE